MKTNLLICGALSLLLQNTFVFAGSACNDLEYAAHTNDLGAIDAALRAGVDPNCLAPDSDSTPLIAAVRYNRLEAAELLIKRGADVNQHVSCFNWENAITIAVQNSSLEETAIPMIKLLIDSGVDIEKQSVCGKGSALLDAIAFADSTQIRSPKVALFLLNYVPIRNIRKLYHYSCSQSAEENCTDTLLFRAVRLGSNDVVKKVLDLGEDVNQTHTYIYQMNETSVESPLMEAVSMQFHPEIVRTLIAAHANLNYRDPHGFSALMRAAREDRLANCNSSSHDLVIDTVKALIQAGANLSYSSYLGTAKEMAQCASTKALFP